MLSVGAGPISTSMGRKNLKHCLDGAEKVYFRDSFSKETSQIELEFDKGRVMPDLAMALCYKSSGSVKRKNIILFNVASLYGDAFPKKHYNPALFNEYIEGLVGLALDINAQHKFDEIVIFNSNFPADDFGSRLFFKKLKCSNVEAKVRVLEGRQSVAELMQLGESASLAVTTRLHAGIIVAQAGCKVIGIAYQPKVKNVLQQYGISSGIIELDELARNTGCKFSVESVLGMVKREELKNYTLSIDNILQDLLRV